MGSTLDDGAQPDDDGYFPPGTVHGYKWFNGAYVDRIDVPDTRATGITGIDNDGAIVGQVRNNAGRARGFVADGIDFTTYVPFDGPGSPDVTVVFDIAENGDMVIPLTGVYNIVDNLVR